MAVTGYLYIGGQSCTAVERPHSNDKDVGSDPTAARYEKQDSPTECSPRVLTGSQWKTSDVKAELDL